MSLFLITFLGIYGSLHLYALIRLRSTFSLGTTATILLLAWMVLATCAPLLVHMAEAAGREGLALALAWPGYVWMGCLFIFCAALASLDCARGVVCLLSRLGGAPLSWCPDYRLACWSALSLACLASLYAMYEARQVRVERVTVSTAKLPPTVPRVRIVQISDVHIGLLFRESRLSGIVAAIEEARPDILVSTGDLVDGRLSREEVLARRSRLAAMLAAEKPHWGSFAITGNHEYYAGLEQALSFTRSAAFTVLRHQGVSLPCGVSLAGVDDPAGRRMGLPQPAVGESQLCQELPAHTFRVLLKHRPDLLSENDGQFDLQLSGHVHKGQIFPFNLLVALQYPIPCGTTSTPKGSLIHVSRGSGTWGPPMRLFAPPEVTIIDLIRR